MSGYQTAWTYKSSSLPSDRIPSVASKPPKQIAKGKQRESPIPKSQAVRRLEQLRDGLISLGDGAPAADPTGGCFCQARAHDLSPYTPICSTCGLILCSLNLPHHACPHCRARLLAPPTRQSLLHTLEQSIAETLAKEERERERAIEEARRAAGAFPTLADAATGTTNALDAHPVNQPHKVLSLNSVTKKVTVSSYTQRAPSPSTKAASKEPQEHVPKKTSRPPAEVPFSSKPQNMERPWFNTRPGSKSSYYISRPVQQPSRHAEPSSSARQKKGNRENGTS